MLNTFFPFFFIFRRLDIQILVYISVEKIAKSNDIREVDFATGYAIASVAQMKKQGKITQAQRKALEDLIYNTADDTAKEIKENSGSLYTEDNEVLAELVEMQ